MKTWFVYWAALAVFILCFSEMAVAAPDTGDVMRHGDAADIMVARVNGAGINMAQLMARMLDSAEKRYGRREITPNLAQKIKDDTLQKLITEELAYQNAAKSIQVSADDVQKAVDERIKSLGGEKALKAYMREKQIKDRAQFFLETKKILTVQRYIEINIVPKIEITEDEIKLIYDKEKNSFFRHPENVQVTKITFFVDPQKADSLKVVKAVRQKLIKELANGTSPKPDGTFIVQKNVHLNKTADRKLYDIAKKLDKFKFSKPVKMNGTFYVVQLTGYQPAMNKPLKAVHNYIRGELFSRQRQYFIDQWLKTIRHPDDKIEIMDLMP